MNVEKLQVEPQIIRKCVESLISLLLESCRSKFERDGFQEFVLGLGFPEEHEVLLYKLYSVKKELLTKALSTFGLKLPHFLDVEWRFEAQIASRSMLKQVVPLVTLDFALRKDSNSDEIEHVALQTDPNNLLHLAQELDIAVRQGHSRHIRRIARIVDST